MMDYFGSLIYDFYFGFLTGPAANGGVMCSRALHCDRSVPSALGQWFSAETLQETIVVVKARCD